MAGPSHQLVNANEKHAFVWNRGADVSNSADRLRPWQESLTGVATVTDWCGSGNICLNICFYLDIKKKCFPSDHSQKVKNNNETSDGVNTHSSHSQSATKVVFFFLFCHPFFVPSFALRLILKLLFFLSYSRLPHYTKIIACNKVWTLQSHYSPPSSNSNGSDFEWLHSGLHPSQLDSNYFAEAMTGQQRQLHPHSFRELFSTISNLI